MARRLLLVLLVFSVATLVQAAPLKPGLNAKVPVSQATKQDWTFAVASQSLAAPPAEWLGDHDPKTTTFDLFVPALKGKQPIGLVLYIAADNNAGGSGPVIEACKSLGFACAAVRGAGNNVPPRQRVHMALSVLDEVRTLLPIDADRTYVAGFSGGARMACAIGFGLPELFGGILSIGAAAPLREESYLRQRCIDRLNVAFVVGEKDFNRGEAESFRGPMLKDVGVRTLVKVVPGQGHGVPNAKTLAEVIQWLDTGTAKRRELAKTFPASRLAGTASRAEQAQALLDEGKKRLEKTATVYSGLMQLKACLERWPDTRPATAAKRLLEAYEAKNERPWEEADIAEQRRFLIAQARGLTAYTTSDLPKVYADQRPDMARAAIKLWSQILVDGQDAAAVVEARKHLPELKKLAEEK